MTPVQWKVVLGVLAALFGAASLVPQFAPYAPALTYLSGALTGGAFIPRPGDARAQDTG
jgi:hypothetical protein